MTTYLEIVVNLPQVAGVFHYHLPPGLEGKIKVGHLVIVPFGRQVVQGVVLGFVDQPGVTETRPVEELVDPRAVLTAHQIELAHHMAQKNLAPLSACIGLMLPPGLEQRADVLYTARQTAPADLTSTQKRLLGLLHKRGPLRGGQIDRAMGPVNWRVAVRPLVRRDLVTTQSILTEPKVSPKIVRTVQLACLPSVASKALPDLGRAGSEALERRQAMMNFLLREPGPVNVSWVYAESGGNSSDLRFLSQRGLVILGESEVFRDPLDNIEFQPSQPPELTQDQRQVWEKVREGLKAALSGDYVAPFLLHGVTGSGKTEIYLRAVDEVLALGKQAIVLVPEIALTPQTVRRFVGRFPGRVGLIHSGLSNGERYDTWRRARAGELALVVGPRSALFTPFSDLSLIVVDESHDESYYQSEAAPYYHAREAAVDYARLVGGVCLLGSATPDVTSAYRCQQDQWQYLRLPSRILAHREAVQAQMDRLKQQQQSVGRDASRFQPLEGQADATDLPQVSVVDMRQELQAGNRSIFSRVLQAALKDTLDREQQAILFLNRRGTATYVFCRDCGHTLKCPRCEIPLTYHQAQGSLVCHYCSYQRKMPQSCPACGSQRIRHYGTGTQKVEAEVQAMFPQARTLRWDYETTRKKGAHDMILDHFVSRRADVLVGTQMLAKGLDLPLVTLVGVVLADVGLSLPDYRANERAFQVLTQVAGRAGRSPLGGQVILQTFQAEHYVIRAAAGHDYKAFYQQELDYRRQLDYPPFRELVRLEYRNFDPVRAERAATALAGQLHSWLAEEGRRATKLIGPVPCFFSRMGGVYRWQIILSGMDLTTFLRGRALNDWKIEVNPPNLL
jgi:primosomal protein N' (replication factor Y)